MNSRKNYSEPAERGWGVILWLISLFVLAVAFFCLAFPSESYSQAPTPAPVIWSAWTGKVGWWHMDEASGDITDSTGGGHTGVDSGSPVYQQPGMWGGYSIKFDGATDFFTVSDSPAFNVGSEMSVVCWINYTSTHGATDQRLLSKSAIYGDYEQDWGISVPANQVFSSVGDTTTKRISTSSEIVADTWIAVAVTYNIADQHKLFTNGVRRVQEDARWNDNSDAGTLFIGAMRGPAGYFEGYLDEVIWFDRELSESEILQMYNNATPIPSPTPIPTPTPTPTPIPPEVTMAILPFQYSGALDMGSNPTFVQGEIKNIYIQISERDNFAWTWDTSTYWTEASNAVTVVSEATASRIESDRLYALADSSAWAEASSPYYMFFRWGVAESSTESFITPIEIDLEDEVLDGWDYVGNNLAFYVGEKKNVWIGGTEENDNNFTLQSCTYWTTDTHGATFMAETDAGLTTSGFRIYGLIDSTDWTTASDPYTVHFQWHLWETPDETFETTILLDAELLE